MKNKEKGAYDFTYRPILVCATYARTLSYPVRWLPVTKGLFVLNSLSCKAAHLRLPPPLRIAMRAPPRSARRTCARVALFAEDARRILGSEQVRVGGPDIVQVTAGHCDGSTDQGSFFRRDHPFYSTLYRYVRNQG